jgi:hypothetical protein
VKFLKKFQESRGDGENFLRPRLTIYRSGGVVSKNRLDSTVVRFPEDTCPLRRFEGDIFT